MSAKSCRSGLPELCGQRAWEQALLALAVSLGDQDDPRLELLVVVSLACSESEASGDSVALAVADWLHQEFGVVGAAAFELLVASVETDD